MWYLICIYNRWYPPGHGDFYQAFANSGLLDELIEREGRTVCFMSNIDNMGATVDLSILKQFIENQNEFIMEVIFILVIINTCSNLMGSQAGELVNDVYKHSRWQTKHELMSKEEPWSNMKENWDCLKLLKCQKVTLKNSNQLKSLVFLTLTIYGT